jgi:uncharacterized membrane protein
VTPRQEANVHRLFEIALLLKAANSLTEIVSGAALALINTDGILRIANWLTQHELLEDPNDLIANYVLRLAEGLSVGAKTAAAFFLFSHGVIKLALVLGVLAGLKGAYPAFIAALAVLIAYQTYQLSHIFSAGLFALTLLDVLVLVLTVHEYRLRRVQRQR